MSLNHKELEELVNKYCLKVSTYYRAILNAHLHNKYLK